VKLNGPDELLAHEAKMMSPRSVRYVNYQESTFGPVDSPLTIGTLVYEVLGGYKDLPGTAQDYYRYAIIINGEPQGGGVIQ